MSTPHEVEIARLTQAEREGLIESIQGGDEVAYVERIIAARLGPVESAVLLAKARDAINDEWMRAEHDPGCPGDDRYCSSHCPVPFYASAGFDQLRDAAALAAVSAAKAHYRPGVPGEAS